MYLKEVGIYIKYLEKKEIIEKIMFENNCSYEEAIKIDYDVNWKWNKIRRFELETRCIASMFERLLGKFKTADCSKINIMIVDDITMEDISICLGIYTIQYKLDYNEFFIKSDEEKKKITLNMIRECIVKIVKEKKWDYEPFEDTFNKITELEYNNFWMYKKTCKSPNKLYTGEVYFEHEVKEIKIYLVITNKHREIIKKKLIITELPDEYAYFRHIGELTWVSDTKFQMSDITKEKVWGINL